MLTSFKQIFCKEYASLLSMLYKHYQLTAQCSTRYWWDSLFLCPRLKLQIYLLVSRLIIRGGGGGAVGMQGPRHVYQPWRNHHSEGYCCGSAPTWAHWSACTCPLLKAWLWEDQEAAVRCQATIAQASVFLPRTSFTFGGIFVLLTAEAQRLNLPAREALVEF